MGSKDRSAPRRTWRTLAWHLVVPALAAGLFVLQGPSAYVLDLRGSLFNLGSSLDGHWLMAWLEHALLTPGLSVWDPPVFHPLKGALALVDPPLGNLLVYAPARAMGAGPVLATNLVVMAGFILSAYCMFLLVRTLSGSGLGGAAAGLLFAFNPAQWDLLAGMTQGAAWAGLLALHLLERFLQGGRGRHVWGAGLAMLLQATFSAWLAAGFILFGVALVLHRAVTGQLASLRLDRAARIGLLGAMLLLALGLAALLTPLLSGPAAAAADQARWTTPGVTLPLLALALVLLSIGPARRGGEAAGRTIAATLAALALALAAPEHLAVVLLAGLSACGGVAVAAASRLKLGSLRPVRLLLLAALVAAVNLDYWMPDQGGEVFAPAGSGPGAYSYLGRSKHQGPVLELPVGPPSDSWTLGHQPLHWRPKLGGPGRWRAPGQDKLLAAAGRCPGEACLAFLRRSGARTILVHLDHYAPEERRAWLDLDAWDAGFETLGVLGDALVWERRTTEQRRAVPHPRHGSESAAEDGLDALIKQTPPPLPPDRVGDQFEKSELKHMDVDPGE